MSDLLNKASLVVIPSGYKEDTVYSVVPSDGSGDLSFTRASNGTRINSAGLVEVTPWNVWTGSNDFSATYWQQYQLTPTTGTTTDIYGNSSTVYKLIGSVTNSYSFINRSSNGSTNTAFSVYAKPNGYTKIGISNRSGGAWNFVVDLVTKVVSNIYDSASSIVSINVIDAVGDWKRIEVVVSSAIQYNLHPLPSNFNSTDFDNVTLNGTDGVWVMASQVNIGSTAKPYFPTTDRLNVPRLTYQNGGGGCPSLLLEKQSTNLFSYSEQFDNAGWTKLSSTITANSTTSPDGTQNADSINDTTSNSRHVIEQPITGDLSISRAMSLYAKQNTLRYLYMSVTDAGDFNCYSAVFDLQSGIVSATKVNGSATINASIESVGNGWYRCIITGTMTTGTATFYPLIGTSDRPGFTGTLINNNAPSYAGSGQSLYIWGAQLEASSYPTSYINTTSASATRVADACSKTGISSLIGQSEGVLFADFVYLGETQSEVIDISDGTEDNRVMCYITSSSLFQIYVTVGGTTDGLIQTSFSPVAGTRYKIAVGYKLNDIIFYVNGTSLGTDTSTTIPATSKLTISNGGASNYRLASQFNQAVLFKTRLTNSELASLTTL